MSSNPRFAADCLDAHNNKRIRHGVPKLKLNSELCALAENWANKLLRSKELKNSENTYKGNSLGENIACRTSTGAVTEYSGSDVVEQWYKESKDYDFKNPGAGHFSQMVWKDSQEFGVGMATKDGRCVVVAHYYPAGNVIGRHKENVFPDNKSAAPTLKSTVVEKKKSGSDRNSSSSDEEHPRAGKSSPNSGQVSSKLKFAAECLDAHNDKRARHRVSKLKLNSELCALAENWARDLVRSKELKNSGYKYKGNSLGENIACRTSTGAVTEYTGSDVVEQWYKESKDYNFKNPEAGNFSQMIWKDSQELGIGMATKDGRCVVVAYYYPAGNVIGQHKENVYPEDKSTISKLQNLVIGKKKTGRDSSSSSSDEEDHRPGKSTTTSGKMTSIPGASTSTSKVTVTKTIRKPDGTVETIVEERVEESNGNIRDKVFQHQGPSEVAQNKPSQSESEFRQEALDIHNKYRARHGAPSLKLNKELCSISQKWAEHLATISSLAHSNSKHKGEPLGENVASKWTSTGADYTGEEVVEQWYSEEPLFDYTGKSNAGKAGHFSQVVWKSSAELGIGKAKDNKGRVFVVANYFPAGNFLGRFAENVFNAK